ncbi:hypothetical protein GCM10009800_25390 [Nocardiopsis rhodophaea]
MSSARVSFLKIWCPDYETRRGWSSWKGGARPLAGAVGGEVRAWGQAGEIRRETRGIRERGGALRRPSPPDQGQGIGPVEAAQGRY